MEFEFLDVSSMPEWRSWLREHHGTEQGVWLVFHRAGSKTPSISYDDALDEALAYGWIDSIIKKIDSEKYARKFTPRRPGSIWSKLNIERVERLRREDRMTKWGLGAFVSRTDKISMLEKVNAEGAKVPEDFASALRKNSVAWSNFERMAPSHRKRYLVWIAGAKKPDTRQKRIAEAVILISRNLKNLMK